MAIQVRRGGFFQRRSGGSGHSTALFRKEAEIAAKESRFKMRRVLDHEKERTKAALIKYKDATRAGVQATLTTTMLDTVSESGGQFLEAIFKKKLPKGHKYVAVGGLMAEILCYVGLAMNPGKVRYIAPLRAVASISRGLRLRATTEMYDAAVEKLFA